MAKVFLGSMVLALVSSPVFIYFWRQAIKKQEESRQKAYAHSRRRQYKQQ